jgi:glycosyltransferase involved in cell wall biosynthesis
MITVIVYTHDDQETIGWCLSSLASQKYKNGFEVIVIDDCSEDRTPEIIERDFPKFKLIRNAHRLGWVASLRKHLSIIKGDILAFLGAHCRAREDWLVSIEEEMQKGCDVLSGIGYIGTGNLFDRYVAFGIPSYWEDQEEAEFLWDDNFAIKRSILESGLPETRIPLAEGAGAVLLSKRLKAMEVFIHSRPSVKIDHVGNSLKRVIGLWYDMAAENAVSMRRADPSLSGGRILTLWPLAAMLIATGRLVQSSLSMIRTRRMFRVRKAELVFHLGFQTVLMPVYFLGLCRHLFVNR